MTKQTETETAQFWHFTFGNGNTHPVTGIDLSNRYVTISGSYDDARAEMLARFGRGWCDQYEAYVDGSAWIPEQMEELPRIEWPALPDVHAARMIRQARESARQSQTAHQQVPNLIADLVADGWTHDATTEMDVSVDYTLHGPDGETASILIGRSDVDLEMQGLTEVQARAAVLACSPVRLAAAEPVEPDLRQRLAAELHRIADDIARQDLPVGYGAGLNLGVLDARADLERWSAYLDSRVRVDTNGIPNVEHRIRLAGYSYLTVQAQTRAEHRSEVEALRARVAELEAQQAGGVQ